jgi:hypothetical protein
MSTILSKTQTRIQRKKKIWTSQLLRKKKRTRKAKDRGNKRTKFFTLAYRVDFFYKKKQKEGLVENFYSPIIIYLD